MNEREFQSAVIDLGHMFRWRIAHFRAAINQRGRWMTPVAADGAGWPDLVLVNPRTGQCLFRELKSDTGRLTPVQEQWGRWLTGCGLDWAVWRPRDLDDIARVLSGGRAATTPDKQGDSP